MKMISFDILLNDTDVDLGDSLTLTAFTEDSPGSGVLFSFQSNGRVDFDADGNFEQLSGGETTNFLYTAQITDSQGATDTGTTTLTITGVNDCPTGVDDSGGVTYETTVSSPLTIDTADVLSNDSDPDTNDDPSVLTLFDPSVGSAQAPVPRAVVVIVLEGSGATVTLDTSDAEITYDPTTGNPGATDTFGYVLWDGACTSTALVTIEIVP